VFIVRTLLTAATIGAVVVGGVGLLIHDTKQRTIDELREMNDDMQLRLDRHRAMIERLSRTRRVAHVHVPQQNTDENGEVVSTTLEFIELDDEGGELGRQTFTVPGGIVFVDAWTVKFEADDVAHGHPMRGRSLCLLRRIYSDQLAPKDGLEIDTPGAIPPGYAASELSRYEKSLWENFWEIASDWSTARAMGVRVAQGEAVYKPVRQGQRFELVLDAVGGMSLTPLQDDAGQNAETLN